MSSGSHVQQTKTFWVTKNVVFMACCCWLMFFSSNSRLFYNNSSSSNRVINKNFNAHTTATGIHYGGVGYALAFSPIASSIPCSRSVQGSCHKRSSDNLYTLNHDVNVHHPGRAHFNGGKSWELFFFRKILGGGRNDNNNNNNSNNNNRQEPPSNDDKEKEKDETRDKVVANDSDTNNSVVGNKDQMDVRKTSNHGNQDNVQDSNRNGSRGGGPMFFARLMDRKKKDGASSSSSSSPLDGKAKGDDLDQTSVPTTSSEPPKLSSFERASVVEPEPKPVQETEPVAVPVAMPEQVKVVKPAPKVLSLREKAEALKADAERARLEAEKMDVLLTLGKIEKLQKELGSKSVSNDPTRAEAIQNQIQALKIKLSGNGNGDGSKQMDSKNVASSDSPNMLEKVNGVNVVTQRDLDSVLSSVISETKEARSLSKDLAREEDIQFKVKRFQEAPRFMQDIVAKSLGVDGKDDDMNATEIVLKLYKDESLWKGDEIVIRDDEGAAQTALSSMPEFTQEQIDEVLGAVKLLPQFIKNMYGEELKNNDTAIALMMLEEEWKSGNLVVMPEITQKMIDEKLEEIQWIPQYLRGENSTELAIELIKADFRRNKGKQGDLSTNDTSQRGGGDSSRSSSGQPTNSKNDGFGLFGGDPKSEKDQMVESLFPDSTRKKGEEISEDQAILFMKEVLAKDNVWMATGPPEKVSGGYLIRGSTRFESGNDLITAMDNNLVKSRLRNKVNCFYIFDPTPVTEDQLASGERPPLLFLTASNVARDPAPVQRSLISAVTFGTIWYNCLLPYLLNDKYMKLTEEQLALADASMPSNVDFLNDLSFPLFVTTVGIQAIHELSHFVAARNNGLNITVPTLVPSLGTGLLGGITSLKDPPKDKQSLFDFAISGPLAGMGASFLLLMIGMMTTVSLDASSYENLPALPLNLLRQSSLAGGIINAISPGLLTVPDAALGSKALSEINIPLHPLAIAGYFGMMINAVNLLPVGRTDGGRIALTLFGRSGTQLVSFLMYVLMFIQGLLGSDLLLFFFSFVAFFQSELEIPQRNEVDDMDFSRVLLATATGVLVLLTLIPM